MEQLVEALKSGSFHKIVVLAGAGISVASGIPDFRSPKVGLYASIKDTASLQNKSASFVFQMEVFKKDPRPFWWIFCKMWPKTAQALPTPFHMFLKLLDFHGMLLRCYTQNIDGLEKLAGLPPEKVIHAHGVIDTCHCLGCGQEYSISYCMSQITENLQKEDNSIEETTVPICRNCKSNLIKPDMVFFHEFLPNIFFEQYPADLNEADLLIVVGTSLEVYPFASLPKKVRPEVKRFVISKKAQKLSLFKFKTDRDWQIVGDCQEIAKSICDLLGWRNALDTLLENRKDIGSTWINGES
ncbi:NAD-dependent protein deacetylase sirtuin-2 [Tritrichomonas foetus]|uniref:NAD-dependent protein deacetylase sirtuin-2 n=1 Tax=Tritrichomonas foetus TaxID=1144522 RepID=A0A1J4K2P2_9EUKA|nr:NAD-dependent protein deacetylase sirtuin-2 [Tritrichomonas foetus]|eukprot:OHT05467.1 NAD-dependent protein deacetylase sirtuin-2 [Tritrichomonas foetus]